MTYLPKEEFLVKAIDLILPINENKIAILYNLSFFITN